MVKYLLWPLIPWNLTLALQTEDSGAQEEDTKQHYDPMAAAADAWGDDGSQPVRYDPIAAATEGWGDDGSKPVRYDSVTEAQEGGGGDESQQDHYDPLAETQEGWGDDGGQPVTEVPATEVPATEDETPAAETPADAAEEEATPAAATLDNEEGQVTKERENGEMHLDENGGCIDWGGGLSMGYWKETDERELSCEWKGGKMEKSWGGKI